MRYVLGLPTDQHTRPEEFLTAAAVAEIAQAAERSGFDAVSVTDHPFPQDKWLAGGGHQALDPLISLAFAAARTTSIRLLTNVYVIPYHNPVETARAVSTLDVLSGGRVILGSAVGYLRSEFAALGVGYDDRGSRTDEAIDVMKAVWTGESVTLSSPPHEIVGHTMAPAPVQRPHPPLWFGGNSTRAMRRVVEHGQGWMPMPQPASMSKLTRTPGIETIADLAGRVDMLNRRAADAGRPAPDVCFVPFGMRIMDGASSESFAALEADLAAYREAGVGWLSVPFSAATRDQLLDAIELFGRQVISGQTVESAHPNGVIR